MARTNLFAGTRPPKDKRERDAVLNTLFPFVLEQGQLQQGFRAQTESCGEIDRSIFLKPVNPSGAPEVGARDNTTVADPDLRDKDDP